MPISLVIFAAMISSHSLALAARADVLELLSSPTYMNVEVLLEGEDLDFYVTSLEWLSDTELVLFSIPDKQIWRYDIATGELDLLARDGEGPKELRNGFIFSSVIDGEILVSEFATSHTKAFRPGQPMRTISRTPWRLNDWVSLGNQNYVGVIIDPGGDIWDENYNPMKAPKQGLAIFTSKGTAVASGSDSFEREGAEWALIDVFYSDHLMDDADLDNTAQIKTVLAPIGDTGRFYHVPLFGNPNYQVFDASGQLIRESPIPHPFGDRNPEDPFLRADLLRQRKTLRLLSHASSDRAGNLHVVLSRLKAKKQGHQQPLCDRSEPERRSDQGL
jgi:hypothetical protein